MAYDSVTVIPLSYDEGAAVFCVRVEGLTSLILVSSITGASLKQ